MAEISVKPNPSGSFLVIIDGAIPVGKPRQSKNENQVYQGGSWITSNPISGKSKKDHLYRLNVTLTDCGEKRNK